MIIQHGSGVVLPVIAPLVVSMGGVVVMPVPVGVVVVAVSQKKKSEFHAHAPTQREESMIIQHCCGVVLPVMPPAVVVTPPVDAVLGFDAVA